jgi:hypothetical protein
MNNDVRAVYCSFTDRFEGKCNFLYTDQLGLVTSGRGNLLDTGRRRERVTDPMGPISAAPAIGLPWRRADGTLAIASEVAAEWMHVKQMWPVIESIACASITKLRLDWADVDALTFAKVDEMWIHLRGRWPDIETWPSPAQLGVISMAWAMGAAFDFPHFTAAALAKDWGTCSIECRINQNPPVARNKINAKLFTAAANGLDLTAALAT